MGEHTKEFLRDGICVAASPYCFNDPFDSMCILKSKDVPAWAKISTLINGLYRHTFRILSLCKTPMSLQMWTHYADEGRGICIGIESEEKNKSFNIQIDSPVKQILSLRDIEYCDLKGMEIDWDNPFLDFQEINDVMIFRKMKEWSYEEEVRACIPASIENDLISKIHLVSGTIKEIILGYRISLSDTKEILNMINNPNTACYQAKTYKIFPTWEFGYLKKIKYPISQKEKQ